MTSKIYIIEYESGITRIGFSRKPTYEETKSAIDDLAENYPYEKRLWDFRDLEFDFTMDEIRAIAEYGKLKFIKPNRIAIIASDDLAYGQIRAFEVYREQEDHSVARVFRTEPEALEWLRQ